MALDVHKQQFTDSEFRAMVDFLRLADCAGGPQVICARAYNGIPSTAGNGLSAPS